MGGGAVALPSPEAGSEGGSESGSGAGGGGGPRHLQAAASAWTALSAAERYGIQILQACRCDGEPSGWVWLDANACALKLFGIDIDAPDAPDAAQLRGASVRERAPGETTEALLERLAEAAATSEPSEFEQYVPESDRGDGEEGAWFHVTVVPDGGMVAAADASPGDDEVVTLLVVSRTITEYKTLLRHAVDLMNHDDLTGLANRRLLKARFWVRRRRDQPISLLYFDLNGFKQINDTHGHETGDRVLEITAQRLAKNTRPDEIVARIGGDEFAVLLGATDRMTVQRVVRRLLRALEAPIHLGALHLRISAAVGIAYHPEDGDTFDALMNAGDSRMYEHKREEHGFARDAEP